MAVAKRKKISGSARVPDSLPKRIKTEQSRSATPKESRFTEEAETDSDPIIESETGSESGEDDGINWPSDGEGGQAPGVDIDAENNISTKDLVAESVDESPAQRDVSKSSKTSSGTQ